jgi:hypothetical protein
MCGPSSSETRISGQQESLANQLSADFASRFSDQSKLLQQLSSSISPIIQAGPNQQGFSAAENAALNTQAINSSGAAARNARAAAGNFTAGQNNTSGLESGVTKQINASIDSSAANNLANEQLGITRANYDTGRQNYFAGLNALQGVTSQYNPGEFSGQAQSGFDSSFKMADKIQQEKNQQEMTIASGITSLAMDAATFGMGGFGNLDTTGGSTGGEQAGNFFSGGLKALSGKG